MPAAPLQRVRRLCLSYPRTEERLSHGEPTWFAGGRRSFVMYADHHHDDREAFWAAAPAGAQEALIADDPSRYFRPPYVGARGWVGVYLDVPAVDWARVEDVVDDAWHAVAGPRLVAEHHRAGQRLVAEADRAGRDPGRAPGGHRPGPD